MEILVMVKCSYCGQENREELANCAGCGTPLSSARSGLEPAPRYTPLAKRRLIHGGFWLAGGLLVTAVTYRSASPGATYLVAWGAILFGAVQLLQGLFGGRQPPRLETPAMTNSRRPLGSKPGAVCRKPRPLINGLPNASRACPPEAMHARAWRICRLD